MDELEGGLDVTVLAVALARDVMVPALRGRRATARDPGAAFEEAKSAIAGLREAVLATGVEVRDLQTSQVNLHPTYDREGRINGHQASLGMRITVRDIAGSGVVIDAVTAGAGEHARLGGIRLDHSDPAALVVAARQAAVADARSRAQSLALLVGRQLGRCTRLEEVEAHMAPRMMAARSTPAAEMVVDGGEVEQAVTVATVWEFTD